MSRYRILGVRDYRGHRPGDEVEMVLTDQEETRAVQRGAIELLERSEVGLVKGSYKLPKKRSTAKRKKKSSG